MDDFQKRFNRHKKTVSFMFWAILVFNLVFLSAVGFVIYKAVDTLASEDWSGGIRPVIEKIWCGAPDCLK